jgi:hypothetical protein
LGGGLIAPFAIPILSPQSFIAYQHTLGIQSGSGEIYDSGALPQFYADRFGWENMTRTVAEVYNSLSPEQQAECVIYVTNYGEAGAITYFGRKYGLPPAICGHNSYFLWGPGQKSGDVTITVGIPAEDLEDAFETVEQKATVISPYAMPYESDLPVNACLGRKTDLRETWASMKHYI